MVNAHLTGSTIDRILRIDLDGRDLLNQAANRIKLSARGYYRLLKVARTIADLDGFEGEITRNYMAEALSYRRDAA